MNDLMSGGMHRLWKDRFVARVKPRPGEAILDMAGGTGDIAFRMAKRGRRRHGQPTSTPTCSRSAWSAPRSADIDGLVWQVENAEKLSFADNSFDAYTIAFGIRNVTDIPAALREAHRVLKRGGRFYCLEFSTSEWPGFGEALRPLFGASHPKIGKAVAEDEESYRYLVESIRRFPKMEAFRAMIGEAGFKSTSVEPILGGLVAIHGGWKI